jgi:hypothetical protein
MVMATNPGLYTYHDYRPKKTIRSKASIEYILSSSPSTPSPPSTAGSSSFSAETVTTRESEDYPPSYHPAMVMDDKPKDGLSRFEQLPVEVLSNIAFHLIMSDERRRPRTLLPVLLTSRPLCKALRFDENYELYNRLFRATFDWQALERRYLWMVRHLSRQASRGRGKFDLFR